MTKKKKNNKQEQVEEPAQVVFASSNIELLDEAFKEAGLPSFAEQFMKMAEKFAKEQEEKGSSSPTTEEGQDG